MEQDPTRLDMENLPPVGVSESLGHSVIRSGDHARLGMPGGADCPSRQLGEKELNAKIRKVLIKKPE